MNLNQVFFVLLIYYVTVAISTLTNKTTMKNLNRGLIFHQVVNIKPLYNFVAEFLPHFIAGCVDSQHHQKRLMTDSVRRTPQFIMRIKAPKNRMRSVFENSIAFYVYNGSLLEWFAGLESLMTLEKLSYMSLAQCTLVPLART